MCVCCIVCSTPDTPPFFPHHLLCCCCCCCFQIGKHRPLPPGPPDAKKENEMTAVEIGCRNNCTGHGTCPSGSCTCHAGWEGVDCSIRIPPPLPPPEPKLYLPDDYGTQEILFVCYLVILFSFRINVADPGFSQLFFFPPPALLFFTTHLHPPQSLSHHQVMVVHTNVPVVVNVVVVNAYVKHSMFLIVFVVVEPFQNICIHCVSISSSYII